MTSSTEAGEMGVIPGPLPARRLPAMPVAQDTTDWKEWMRSFGRQARRIREFLGFSQDELARQAGVSQGAVSRLEAGRGLATPLLVVLKINIAVVRALRAYDPELLTDELRRALDFQMLISPPVGDIGFHATPVLSDPQLERLIALFRGVPDRQRETFVSVVDATAQALASTAGAARRKAE